MYRVHHTLPAKLLSHPFKEHGMKDQIAYQNFFAEVKERIRKAQYEALRAVNKELVGLYWDLGKMIVEKQAALGWGKSVVQQLAEDLQKTFPGMNGLSAQNLWNMRFLYLQLSENPKLQTMSGEISWSNLLLILSKCKDDLEREFYLLHVRKFGWTYRVLEHHIENKTYEKYLLNQTNFDQILGRIKIRKISRQRSYTFDFLHDEQRARVGSCKPSVLSDRMGAHFIGSPYPGRRRVYFLTVAIHITGMIQRNW